MDSTFLALLDLAKAEDFGDRGDITTDAIFTDQTGEAVLVARESGVLSGRQYATYVLKTIDPQLVVDWSFNDSENFELNSIIFRVQGKIASILKAERIVLNFLGFLSGIATKARLYQNLLRPLGATQILDTRKTVPGFRSLSKESVVHGGAKNHRIGLYDMVMIKDNHADGAGGITKAVEKVREKYRDSIPIEVECRTLDQVSEALALSVDVIMLDNMDPDTCNKAVALRKGNQKTKFEASGDMDEKKILEYGSLGLDYISVGKLTHSVKNINFSLRIVSPVS